MVEMMVPGEESVTLETGPDRIVFKVRAERFATYLPYTPTPGFTSLLIADQRRLTGMEENEVCLTPSHGNVDGIAFGSVDAEENVPRGTIVTTDLQARRGSQSVGFRQECDWIAPDGDCRLQTALVVRVTQGPSAGAILDLTVQFAAPHESEVVLGRTQTGLLPLRLVPALFPVGGGQVRNALGDYGVEAMHNRCASWCGCIGVVAGMTIGLAFLEHPDNLFYPTRWTVGEDGFLTPSPFAGQELSILPRETLTLRYRIQTHCGYVDEGWAGARLAEFAREPLRA